jgi:hypothetical protein
MKKFIKQLVLFLSFFAMAYCIMVCVIGELAPYHFRNVLNYRLGSNGYLHSKIKEIKDYKNVDILFIGTSHAYRGFDVRIFKDKGYHTFNLGSSIQTPIQTHILFQRYLDKLHPKLVVYDVNPEIFGSDGVESALDVISNDSINWDSCKMALEVNNVKTYNTLIFALYKQITNANANFKEPIVRAKDTYISGGFVEKKITTLTSDKQYDKVRYQLDEQQLRFFTQNLQMLRDRQIPFVLVHMPLTKRLYQSKLNYPEFSKLMQQKSGGSYYDFNQMIKLDDSLHFYDDNHLNQNGVTIFDAFFISKMEEEKVLVSDN